MQVPVHTQVDLQREQPLPPALASDSTGSAPDAPEELTSHRSAEGTGATERRPTTGMSARCAEHARAWTPARREAVESYLIYLQRVLRLQDWTITVDWSKPTRKDALATMTQMSDSKHATMRLSPEFTTEAPQLHGQILVHEMLHCHLFQMENLAATTVAALAGKQATAVFNVAYTAENELVTDALADAISPMVAPFHLP